MRSRLFPGVLCALLAVACTDPPAPPTTTTTTTTTTTPPTTTPPESVNAAPVPPMDPRVPLAKKAAEGLRDQLLVTVKSAVAASGPAAALDVCKIAAPQLTAAAQKAGQDAGGDAGTPSLQLGRTALRLRNPTNAPAPWMKPLLAQLEAQDKSARHPVTTDLPDGSLGVLLPIPAAAPCLACHGDVAADVTAALATAYPNDQAVGFAEGDLRGAFWAVVGPLPKPTTP